MRSGAGTGARSRRVGGMGIGAALLMGLLLAAPARAACPGDCDGDGRVVVGELVRGVAIALSRQPLSACPPFDRDGDGQVRVNELLIAVNAALGVCPPETPSPSPTATNTFTASPSSTPTETETPASSPTATVNHPPQLPAAFIYRTHPGLDVQLPLGVTDPDGGALACSLDNVPEGATFDADAAALHWTPAADQLGPYYLPFSCHDDAMPPQAVQGQLTLSVAAQDKCAILDCDPASGCTSTLPPPSQECCHDGPVARVAEPMAGCPEGRVLYVGRNFDGFGRLQNCDKLRIRVFQQAGAEVLFHVQTRCMNTFNRVRLHARLVSASPDHTVLFDSEQVPFFLDTNAGSGFDERRNIRFGVAGGGPFFDLENAEANLTLTLTDSDGVSVNTQVRVILGSMEQLADLPDVDPPLPTATATATETETATETATPTETAGS